MTIKELDKAYTDAIELIEARYHSSAQVGVELLYEILYKIIEDDKNDK